MDPMLIAAAAGLLISLAVVVWYLMFRKQLVKVYHVGAISSQLKELEGQKILVYGFMKPVYGKAVKLVGHGGTIKARSNFYPSGGKVFEGTIKDGIFWIEKKIDQTPGNWRLEWVGK
jgi:predicted ABC-type sugar transport system permease subunit